MFLKLKQSIRAGGKQYRPPQVVDTAELKISDDEAKLLVRGGVAQFHDPKNAPKEQPAADPNAPEVITVEEPKAAKATKAKAKTDKE